MVKKCYIDILKNDKEEEGIHYRMKGIRLECTPGYIKHYTLEDLKAKAEKYLGDHELDADTKSKYGLG